MAGADRAVGVAPASQAKQQRIDDRARTKELARLERLIGRADEQERELHEQLAQNATDHIAVAAIGAQLAEVIARKQDAEDAWLQVADE